jgi:hypothetical protein
MHITAAIKEDGNEHPSGEAHAHTYHARDPHLEALEKLAMGLPTGDSGPAAPPAGAQEAPAAPASEATAPHHEEPAPATGDAPATVQTIYTPGDTPEHLKDTAIVTLVGMCDQPYTAFSHGPGNAGCWRFAWYVGGGTPAVTARHQDAGYMSHCYVLASIAFLADTQLRGFVGQRGARLRKMQGRCLDGLVSCTK